MAKENWETYFSAVKKQDWKSAKSVLLQISKQEKNNPQTFVKIGDVCQRTGDRAEAIEAYSRAAQILRMQGFAQKALATYKIALRLDPTNDGLIRRAEILMDEFEAVKATPHIPSALITPEAPAVSEPAEEAAAPAPSPEPAEPCEWLEGTAVTSGPAAAPSAEEPASWLESTSHAPEASFTTPSQIEEPPPTPETAEISEPGATIEEGPAEERIAIPESAGPDIEMSEEQPSEGGDEWLDAAYEALDTRMFKPGTAPAAPEPPAPDEDVEEPVYHDTPVLESEIADAMKQLITPLSERRDLSIPEIFEDLPHDMASSFMAELPVRRFRNGEKVVEEGDSGDSMFIIRSGQAKVVAHLLGKRIELAQLGEGDVFGEVGFLTGRPRTASVITEGSLEVFEINRFEIEKLIEANPDIMAKIEDFYEMRVKDTIRKIKN